jgi:hypothetical protein
MNVQPKAGSKLEQGLPPHELDQYSAEVLEAVLAIMRGLRVVAVVPN